MQWWNTAGWRGTWRIAGALLVSLVFVSVLMTASAQQEVMQHLARTDAALDYSSAWEIKRQVEDAKKTAQAALASERAARGMLATANDKLDDAAAAFDAAWTAILPTVGAFAGRCGLPTGEVDVVRRGQAIAALSACGSDERLSAAERARLAGTASARVAAASAADTWALASRRAGAAQASLAQAQAVTRALASADATAQRVASSFDATTKLRQSWYLGGGLLIDFPPALLQIILSFVSGAFGALLLTLVLAVYPNSQFSVATSGGYGARVLLGGLIALCVFVVLNGGSAVLGTTDPAAGQNNYMAYCAIAILAGMFSDRVAAWLSSRADSFFKTGADAGR